MDSSQPPPFLSSFLGRYDDPIHPSSSRPYVTLTFAQSIDAKIAGRKGKQLLLSGKESMIMTHWMRTMHDAIMIGIGTALNDDPQLNTRHLPPRPPNPAQNNHDKPYHLPRPLILDTYLRCSPTCKLVRNYQQGLGRRPWILCADSIEAVDFRERFDALEKAGVRIVRIPGTTEDGQLSLPAVLKCLKEMGVCSIMVEGGARVIRSFFSASGSASSGMVDSIIVTVAPMFVGDDGVGYSYEPGSDQVSGFKQVFTEVLGRDSIVGLVPVHV
ncbi:bacterial bifunctional deaminase-reductase [Dendrothele bispora CBS 962.96]|uniref:2,5-diamino-6-ribosylamino-4(3H)-pyrimidinone 5'-phosphate reductase n=1 Tax=Dendrothele bispora (strain CBS 962.96) TaxID=1314807 RepID=A0A4S8MFK3_DENBC|nr:bacterial bifunctional deaminase-reductase [Dendrothele bispora CBS 962.96]